MIDPPPAASAVRVWDLPTRLFHWTLALTMIGSIASAKIGGNAMVWHFRFGYLVFALLAFRILWGLVGGRWSRFGSFLFSPATTWRTRRWRRGCRARWWNPAWRRSTCASSSPRTS